MAVCWWRLSYLKRKGVLERHLDALGYEYRDETGNPSFQLFLSHKQPA